ncbi:MAG: tail fiber protein [Thalassolituus sp.]|jgi:microcystin-dependent protein|uniref:phage tail protein n=1 Tax=Thalassolituus sp. TaxID=2030822 RepID=UPI003981AD46
MSDPFVGEIRMFAGNFAPRGWAFCDGQLLAVSQNDALFSLLGTTYGGDGRTTFGLPDMRGRLPVHQGQGSGLTLRRLGSHYGEENVTLTVNEIPPHSHGFMASTAEVSSSNPANDVLGSHTDGDESYTSTLSNVVGLSSDVVATAGGSRSHTNLMPALCVNYIIALFGIYPSRQ